MFLIPSDFTKAMKATNTSYAKNVSYGLVESIDEDADISKVWKGHIIPILKASKSTKGTSTNIYPSILFPIAKLLKKLILLTSTERALTRTLSSTTYFPINRNPKILGFASKASCKDDLGLWESGGLLLAGSIPVVEASSDHWRHERQNVRERKAFAHVSSPCELNN